MDFQKLLKNVSSATLSSPRKKNHPIKKLTLKKENEKYLCTEYKENKAFHKTYPFSKLSDFLKPHISHFKQLVIENDVERIHILFNKRGEMRITHSPLSEKKTTHILQEGTPYPFLQHLGIQNASGDCRPKMRDKFLQINHFLSLIQPLLKEKDITILDAGCGKGYLTFALDYLANTHLKLNAKIIGLDIKKDVIENLNTLAKNNKNLHFYPQEISSYTPEKPIDMVIALHACNTATDDALNQALQWDAKIILLAPCCHQQLLPLIQNEILKPLLRHGVMKERFSALITDAKRAAELELKGYKTDIIEFIDSEHTPKNLLIKAIKRPGKRAITHEEYENFCQALNIPT